MFKFLILAAVAATISSLPSCNQQAASDIAAFNAAGALIVAGKARELVEGVGMADEALRSGAALRVLERLVTVSNA